jgi:hypothetical protein
MAPALQVPSHLPLQSTVTPPLALQLPLQLPEQLPVHARLALPSAVQPPLHSTDSVPPVHFGGLALMSHFASTLQEAWQFAVAVSDALHFGGSKTARTFVAIAALPENVPVI